MSLHETYRFSVVVPVYNRPAELQELLQSLLLQTVRDFEVIIVEDGSSITAEAVIESFRAALPIRYFVKPNEGPGPARNFGFREARGAYLVVFDSDCILPPDYFESVDEGLKSASLDAWGGPDKPHPNFTIVQRAMGYTMSSFLTTGGIRGGKRGIGWFQPRSFNMGFSRSVFEKTGGFRFTRFAEDIEFSIRMRNAGFRVGLIEKAFVYHKRRTSLGQFFRQVSNFGKGRVHVGKVYPGEVKLTHWFPTVFTLGVLSIFLLPLFSVTLFAIALAFLGVYCAAIFLHALSTQKSFAVALYSVPAAFLQLTGYGFGFLKEWFKTYLRK